MNLILGRMEEIFYMLFLLREYVAANLFFFFSGRLYQSSYGIFRNVCFYWGYTHTNFNSFKRWVLQYYLSHFLNYYSNVLEFDITISLVNVIKSPINRGFSCIFGEPRNEKFYFCTVMKEIITFLASDEKIGTKKLS